MNIHKALSHLSRYALALSAAAALAFVISIAGRWAGCVAVMAFCIGTVAFLLAGGNEQ